MQVLEVQNSPSTDSSFDINRIVGSSNGLVCVKMSESGMSPPSLSLWNPAIRQVRKVTRTMNDFEGGDWRLGFGFSPIDNDCKIVRLYVSEFYAVVNPVEVYSLRSGSWKGVEIGNSEEAYTLLVLETSLSMELCFGLGMMKVVVV